MDIDSILFTTIQDILCTETLVVMPAGGTGTRLGADIPKAMVKVSETESMIQRLVRQYSDWGIKNFLVLTGDNENHNQLVEHLGEGTEFDCDISYCQDPPGNKPGNAGAIRNAIDREFIPRNMLSIVHNPDDLLFMRRPFPEVLLMNYVGMLLQDCVMTLIVVPTVQLPYSIMSVSGNVVTDIARYPMISEIVHTGVSLLSPQCYPYFIDFVDPEKESYFETTIGKMLLQQRKLFASKIPSDSWIPVNDAKSLERARFLVEEIGDGMTIE